MMVTKFHLDLTNIADNESWHVDVAVNGFHGVEDLGDCLNNKEYLDVIKVQAINDTSCNGLVFYEFAADEELYFYCTITYDCSMTWQEYLDKRAEIERLNDTLDELECIESDDWFVTRECWLRERQLKDQIKHLQFDCDVYESSLS